MDSPTSRPAQVPLYNGVADFGGSEQESHDGDLELEKTNETGEAGEKTNETTPEDGHTDSAVDTHEALTVPAVIEQGKALGGEIPKPPALEGPAREPLKTQDSSKAVATPCRGGGGGVSTEPIQPPKQWETPSTATSQTPKSFTPTTPVEPVAPNKSPTVPTDQEDDPNKPVPGELRLSQNAINLRLHRAFKHDSKGNCRVLDKIREQWTSRKGKGKLRIQQIFQSCGYDVDRCCSKLGTT